MYRHPNNVTYADAVEMMKGDPEAIYVAVLDGQYYSMPGTKMKGFLILSDVLDSFWKF